MFWCMTIRNYLHSVGIGLLLYGNESRSEIGDVTFSNLSSGIQEHSLNLDMTENCDGSIILEHEDSQTFLSEKPFHPADDFRFYDTWFDDVRWDEVGQIQYRNV